ncbi:hypothetical protein DOTSEDRAFT_72351 [Dothistroma septosporum NZE10]|uniref:Uncharacterized protein n=1 Tax=Dothistroma septosporum (strain NZE10 / CBS 128990) TaxID=675120 RepID=M2Y3K6_DOTSN|nr:hypothetical protein DOTSEDRAFT_72351 [Dothistroma septosporum NZE10]
MTASWVPQYNVVSFRLHLTTASRTVFALSQLNHRYYKGLQGRYDFRLEFLVKQASAPVGQNLAHVSKLVSEEDLQPGTYEVHVKIHATVRGRDLPAWSVEDVVKQSLNRPQKLQQLARNYDMAHRKLEIFDQDWATALPADLAEKDYGDHVSVESPQSDPNYVAWNAVCGVGLRVLSKDPDMQLELHHRNEGIPDIYDAALEQRAKEDVWGEISESYHRTTSPWDTDSIENGDGWVAAARGDAECAKENAEDDLESIYERKLGGLSEVLGVQKVRACSPGESGWMEVEELADWAHEADEPVEGYF